MTASVPKYGADRWPQRKRNAKANELPSFEFEQRGLVAGHQIIAGVDEAGRGPWAGPVVAAAVVLAPDQAPEGIADSKQLTENAREALFEEILKTEAVGLAFADHQ